jgi:hypothetical protein
VSVGNSLHEEVERGRELLRQERFVLGLLPEVADGEEELLEPRIPRLEGALEDPEAERDAEAAIDRSVRSLGERAAPLFSARGSRGRRR